MTRRDLLKVAGRTGAGLALAGGLGELFARVSAAPLPGAPPLPPRWVTRPDLRIPALTVSLRESGASTDPIFIAPYNAPNAQAGAVITDYLGRALWEHPIEGKVTTNFRVQSYRGSPVLVWWEGLIESGHGVGEYVIADAAYRTVQRVQAGNGLRGDLHEFVITPRDTALLTSYELRRSDLTAVGGARDATVQDAIFQEIDLATGRVLIEWHSLDHVPFEESYAPLTPEWDYFHINSVDLDLDGGLLVSSRSTHTVYKIARSGQILWRLGGKRGDFQLGPGVPFAWQHDARRRADGTLTVFDNGATPAVEKLSRGLIIDLDEQAMSATLVRQFTHPGVLAGSQGSVQRLPDGNVFVGWGEVPRVSEFSGDGRLVFDALLGRQYQSYRAFRLPWTGRPADAPAIAIAGPASARAAYASWNGATGVSAWQLLSGPSASSLAVHSQVRSAGFETALAARHAGPLVAVQALDRRGTALGRSAAIPLPA
ncbi:MAG: arylsulfotransferase family protein [Solirubrobacteraceae bacterium]